MVKYDWKTAMFRRKKKKLLKRKCKDHAESFSVIPDNPEVSIIGVLDNPGDICDKLSRNNSRYCGKFCAGRCSVSS